MTFCAAARCPHTGALGAAVTTFSVNVGRVSPLHTGLTPTFSPGGGLVFVHSTVSLAAGQAATDAMARGESSDDVLAAMAKADPHFDWRQITLLRPDGEIRVVSGEGSMPWAGHEIGDGWTVSGNSLAGPEVVAAMAEAIAPTVEADGAPIGLSERLLRSLEAGRAAGGQQDQRNGVPITELSAILLVFDGQSPAPTVDLRVDYDPLALPRLRALHDYTAPLGQYYDAMQDHPDAMVEHLRPTGIYDHMTHFREYRDPRPLEI